MYQEKFVAAVKSKGKILREKNGVVTLPFGSEYTLLLKNLNSRKAQVTISIDGIDVLDGKHLLIDPNSDMEFEGFLKGNTAYKKFRFINKTQQISDYRGDKIDDGIVRVEFVFEKGIPYSHWDNFEITKREIPRFKQHMRWDDPVEHSTICMYAVSTNDRITTNVSGCDLMATVSTSTYSNNDPNIGWTMSCSSVLHEESKPQSDEGITVKGSNCNQHFAKGNIGILEDDSSVIILKLRGVDGKDEKVKESITVRTKLKCETCGSVSKSSADFCYKCGTALI